jgi:type VI protein secretion system component VasF
MMHRDPGQNPRNRLFLWVFVVAAVLLTALAWGGNSIESILREMR